jgi:hypothetical protein
MASQQNPTAKKRAFLAAFAITCNISRAAKAAKIDRATHYEWLKGDENYRKEFAEAKEQAADALEDEAVRRAHEGTTRPIMVGKKREVIREYSDTLLIFLLKGIRPEKYRERSEVKMPGLEAKLADILRAREAKPK